MGLIIRTFDENKTATEFVDWNGVKSQLATSPQVSFNLPMSSFILTQGGASYSSPGNCSISSHTGSLSFAYDMQNQTIGKHVLASAEGLVVNTFNSVNCNSGDPNGCADYSANCSSNGGWGNVVIIQHADDTYTRYAHLQFNSVQVSVNASACQGLYLGNQGHTGNTAGNLNGCGDHLHYQRQSSVSGASISSSFSDSSNPLACLSTYTSGSSETSTCSTCQSGTSTLRNRDNGPPIHPPGSVIKVASSSTVYLIDSDNRKRPITSPSVLAQLYNQSTDPQSSTNFTNWVITVGQDELDLYEQGGNISAALPGNGKPFPDGKLIAFNGQVSIVTDSGKRRPFTDGNRFIGLGYNFCHVVNVSQTDYNSYPIGPPVDAMPLLTSSLTISPASPYSVGQNITGSFTIKNVGYESMSFTSLGVGGRLNGSTVYDMNFVSKTLVAGEVYTYTSQPRQLNSTGTYDFFAAFQENNGHWAVSVPAAPGIVRSRQIQVTNTTPISITVNTNPSGRSFTVDGTPYTSAQTFNWTSGSQHTIATTSPQGDSNTRYNWSSWSDGGAISHTVSPTTPTTYTANFTTQHFLTMNAGTGGTISPPSDWYNVGQVVQISATPNSGFTFSNWTGSGSGSYSGTNNPASITMNNPITQTANFTQTQSPSISINDISLNEGNSGTTNFTFNVTLSNPTSQTVSVNYATANGTATAGSDYVSASSTVTFNPNEITKPVTVFVNGDMTVEPNETFVVNLSGVVNATIADNQGIGTIINDDGGCTYSINPTNQSFPASGGNSSVQVITQPGCAWTAVSNSFADSNNMVGNVSLFSLSRDFNLPVLSQGVFGNSSNSANTNNNAIMTAAISENFENIATLPGSGWFLQNNSVPVGSTGWFQGNSAVFPAQAGSYIGANFNNTTGTNTISNWLLTPNIAFNNGDTITFYTRTVTANPFPDRLQVRLSTNGTSTNVASGPTGVGDFTTVLLDINPTYSTAYPEVWTQYTVTVSGLGGSTSGRLAFRYFVENGGPTGDNSNYIGIDTFAYTPATTSNWITITSGGSGIGIGTVNYSVAANTTGAPRPGTMTIAGQTFTVNQSATPIVNNRRPFDFDGDGKTDIGIFRPSNGQWWINRSSNGSTFAATFGIGTDKIVPADYTGDGTTDIAVWRPSSGEWLILRSEDSTYYGFPYGTNGDIPAPGYFDTDNKADATVFRPSTGFWYTLPSTNPNPNNSIIRQFGTNGDIPVVGNYDGDNFDDVAIFRPSNGQWWLLRSLAGVVAYQFGSSTDKPVVGDYTGDGKADVTIWRPSNGTWYVLRSEDSSYFPNQFGTNGDIPLRGNYDGDGKSDFAVFRPLDNTWHLNRSTAGYISQVFGIAGDIPIPSAYVP